MSKDFVILSGNKDNGIPRASLISWDHPFLWMSKIPPMLPPEPFLTGQLPFLSQPGKRNQAGLQIAPGGGQLLLPDLGRCQRRHCHIHLIVSERCQEFVARQGDIAHIPPGIAPDAGCQMGIQPVHPVTQFFFLLPCQFGMIEIGRAHV